MLVVNSKVFSKENSQSDSYQLNKEEYINKKCLFCNFPLGSSSKYSICNNCFQSRNNSHSNNNNSYSNKSTNQRLINILNGKITQSLIAEMFREMGYTVINTGIEDNNGQLTNYCRKITKNQSNSVIKIIREAPDLVIINEDYGIEEAIEVKFRADGKFRFSRNYSTDYCYDEAYLVLVSPRYIKIQQIAKLRLVEPLKFFNYFYDFPVDKNIVINYVNLI